MIRLGHIFPSHWSRDLEIWAIGLLDLVHGAGRSEGGTLFPAVSPTGRAGIVWVRRRRTEVGELEEEAVESSRYQNWM